MRRIAASLSVMIALGALSGCQKPAQEAPRLQVQPSNRLSLAGTRLIMVIPPTNFRYQVFSEVQNQVAEAGGSLDISSMYAGTVTGTQGEKIEATLVPDDVNTQEYAAVVLGGGPGILRHTGESDLVQLAKSFNAAGKYVAAMRVAQLTLAEAELLRGKRVTGAEGIDEKLAAAGAEVTSRPVEVDGLIITARGPKAAREFAQTIVEAVAGGN